MKIMASSPIPLWQIEGETVETVTDLFWASKITADGDCRHGINRACSLELNIRVPQNSYVEALIPSGMLSGAEAFGGKFGGKFRWGLEGGIPVMESGPSEDNGKTRLALPCEDRAGRLQSVNQGKPALGIRPSWRPVWGHPELWRWQWHPTPVLSAGESQGRGSLVAAVHGVARSRTRLSDFTFTFHFHDWRRKWQPTPVFLPGESQGWGSLVGCCLWGHAELDTTEATQQQQQNWKNKSFSLSLPICGILLQQPEQVNKVVDAKPLQRTALPKWNLVPLCLLLRNSQS